MKDARPSLAPLFVLLCASLMAAQTAVPTYQIRQQPHRREHAPKPSSPPAMSTCRPSAAESCFLVSGYVYAQPLYVPNVKINGTSHNVLYVVTEHDQAYAFDVNSGHQLWQNNFLAGSGAVTTVTTVPSTDVSCDDIVPEIGITGTPVIDVATNTLYVVVETKEVNYRLHTTNFYHRLHALDIRTGKDVVAPHTVTGVGHRHGLRFHWRSDQLQSAARPSAYQSAALQRTGVRWLVLALRSRRISRMADVVQSIHAGSHRRLRRYSQRLRRRHVGRRFRTGGGCQWRDLRCHRQWHL